MATTVRCKVGKSCLSGNGIRRLYPDGIRVTWLVQRWNMPKPEKTALSTAVLIGGLLIAAAVFAAGIAGYFYLHTAK
jgi:hypothetical protein